MERKEVIKKILFSVFHLEGDYKSVKDPKALYKLYQHLEEIEGVLEEYKKDLKAHITSVVRELGTKDEKGSYILQMDDGTGFKQEARHRRSLNQEKAANLLREKGFEGYLEKRYKATDDLVQDALDVFVGSGMPGSEQVQIEDYVPDSVLQALYFEESLTEEEIESVVDTKEIYAFICLKPKK